MPITVRDPIYPETFRIYSDYTTEAILEWPLQFVHVRGIGTPSTDHRYVSSPNQDGATYIESVLNPRAVQILLKIRDMWGPMIANAQQRRQGRRGELFDVLNPALAPFSFEMALHNGDIYTLKKVILDAGFDADGVGVGQGPRAQQVALRFRALNPAWWGIARTWTIDALNDNDAGIPVWDYQEPAQNFGTWFADCTIALTGPMTTPRVTLEKWNADAAAFSILATIELAVNIAAGETVTITTEFGNRQAVDSSGDNVTLSDSTTFALFRLAFPPLRNLYNPPDEVHYNNYIRILSPGGCTAASTMTVAYNDRWIGV